jgi:2-polyprenyl-3-methyl-5-hydroxy-6-metoxy-1,4-benzoquinol methylase
VKKGLIPIGKAIDTCCGAGTNSVYLAQSGFEVTGVDISLTAVKIAKKKAKQSKVVIDFAVESFIDLSFKDEAFEFVFDMGCFHHVAVKDRTKFIEGVCRVLKPAGVYMLTCFSFRNGPSWNHFSRQQLFALFSDYFKLKKIIHYPSLEGDGVIRFFFTVLMMKKSKST